MTAEEIQARLKALTDFYKVAIEKGRAKFVVDVSGNIVTDEKGNPSVLTFSSSEVKEADDNEGTIKHFISTPRIDYIMDVMDPFNVDTAPLIKNRGVFYNHQWDGSKDLPIGRCMWISKSAPGVLVKTQYAIKQYDFAQLCYNLAKGGFLNSYSIGWRMNDYAFLSISDLQKLIAGKFTIPNAEEYDPDEKVCYHKSWMCYEYSQVGVPMNMDATVQASLQKALNDGKLASGFVISDYGKDFIGAMVGRMKLGAIGGETPAPTTEIGSAITSEQIKALLDEYMKREGGVKAILVLIQKDIELLSERAMTAKDATTEEVINAKLDQLIYLVGILVEEEQEEDADEGNEGEAETITLENNMPAGTAGAKSFTIDPTKLIVDAAAGAVSRAKGKFI